MKTLALIPLSFFIALPIAHAAKAPVWPADVKSKDDPRVLAFYDEQCAFYADQTEGLADRDAFVAQCREKIAAVFPVGSAKPSGGE